MKERLIQHFKMLTAIDSPSGHEEELADVLVDILEKKNFTVRQDETGNIIARRGQGEPLLICCHMDTVESNAGLKLEFSGDYISSAGDTILGADDKAGIAILLTVLDELEDSSDDGPGLEILLTVQEEVGMLGCKAVTSEMLEAKMGLVLDAAEPVGAIINQAPGEAALNVKIFGVGAHAAANPEKGVDAIRLAANFINKLPEPRVEPGVTFNFGIIRGGDATNTICPQVDLLGEVRSYDDDMRQKIAQRLENILAESLKGTEGRYKYKCTESYASYHVSPQHQIIKLLDSASRPQGITVDVHPRFAGSDANIINNWGVTVVNLGIGVEDGHSFQERVSISAMMDMVTWLKEMLRIWNGSAKY